MPTYKNEKQGMLVIEHRDNPRTSVSVSRTIQAGEIFVARSVEIPARWLAPGNPVEGNGWVTLVSAEPADEELSG
jgi:hypothetical protein